MVDFLVEGRDRIPNLAGIKYTRTNIVEIQRCVRLDDGRFDILFGCDEALLAVLALGIRGAVGSTSTKTRTSPAMSEVQTQRVLMLQCG